MLILGGISSVGMTTFVEDYRLVFFVVTFGFLGSAFYLTYRPRAMSANKFMAFNKVMLWAVTGIVVVFLFFPHVITDLMASDSNAPTAEMRHTVIEIEGMT